MNKKKVSRSQFLKQSAFAGFALVNSGALFNQFLKSPGGKRIGMIGLDTSHCVQFSKLLNSADAGDAFGGYKITAAYPVGSLDIKSSMDRVPEYTEQVKKYGVEIINSIEALLDKVDVVLLTTNDGKRHLEQALPVFKAGKPMFIDKPMTASLKDAISIMEASKKYNVPFFSSSSLRFISSIDAVRNGKVGKVIGAFTFSPAPTEPSHPDFFWYGIHGVEMLYAVMGTGCKQVERIHTTDADVVTGTWSDGRIATFRGTRTGKHEYGGYVFGENGVAPLGPNEGYKSLMVEIIKFFETGVVPVQPEETLEMLAFMEAADESKNKGGVAAALAYTYLK